MHSIAQTATSVTCKSNYLNSVSHMYQQEATPVTKAAVTPWKVLRRSISQCFVSERTAPRVEFVVEAPSGAVRIVSSLEVLNGEIPVDEETMRIAYTLQEPIDLHGDDLTISHFEPYIEKMKRLGWL